MIFCPSLIFERKAKVRILFLITRIVGLLTKAYILQDVLCNCLNAIDERQSHYLTSVFITQKLIFYFGPWRTPFLRDMLHVFCSDFNCR